MEDSNQAVPEVPAATPLHSEASRDVEGSVAGSGRQTTLAGGAATFLFLLLMADVAFIGLHLLASGLHLTNPLFSLERDRGYAEFYQYVKELWIIALLGLLCAKTRVWGYLAWIAVFAYLLGDDAFRFHEEFGLYATQWTEGVSFFGLRARDLGELAMSAIAGAGLLTLLAWCYVRGLAPFRRATRHLLLLLLAVAFCGVGMDMLHAATDASRVVRFLLGVIEDGGEMILMSAIAGYAFLLNGRQGDIGFSLRRFVAASRFRRARPAPGASDSIRVPA